MSSQVNLLLGFHGHIPLEVQNNAAEGELARGHLEFPIKLLEVFSNFENIKAAFHFSGNLISFLDKKFVDFSSRIRNLLDSSRLELFSGGIYEPIFPFIPKEDRQAQLLLMNRLLNHIYGYTPRGAWITECAWEPSLTLDLAKSNIEYICLSKEYFTSSGLEENDILGYYLTEEEGRKVGVFPILQELNKLMQECSPKDAIRYLLKVKEDSNVESPFVVLFHKDLAPDLDTLNWLNNFFQLLEKNKGTIETKLFNEYFQNNKPRGRIYLPTTHDAKSLQLKHFLVKYPEANLLHKKMLRISKKINSAKEGKSRFKVIKEMISQAHDLLLQGQNYNTYLDNTFSGIYLPGERHKAYSSLIKAENLIDAASRKGSRWVQISEIDYDCDGHDEIIIETDTQNIYISPYLGGAVLEHDFKPKNINLINIISRKKETYHVENGSTVYDSYLKLNLIEHFLKSAPTLEGFKLNKTNHLTKEIIHPFKVEKIKAKEETSKVTLCLDANLVNLEGSPEIALIKEINCRAGDSSLNIDYSLVNEGTQRLDFTFGIEFNLNTAPACDKNVYFYLDGDQENKTYSPDLKLSEEIKNINQVSIKNKNYGIDLTLFCNKPSNLFRCPIETISYNYGKLEKVYQGITILLTWDLILEPGIPWELSVKQDIITAAEDF